MLFFAFFFALFAPLRDRFFVSHPTISGEEISRKGAKDAKKSRKVAGRERGEPVPVDAPTTAAG
jgi:hypothetical protein